MNLNELKTKHPAKYEEFNQAYQALADARAQVTPLNHESGALWAEVEKAQAAYQVKRNEAAALEKRLRIPQLSKKLASIAQAIKGL